MVRSIAYFSPLKTWWKQNWQHYLTETVIATIATVAVTGGIYVLRLYPKIPNISLVYLLIILAFASTRGLYTAICASIIAFLSFDFLLVSPLYTFTISKLEEWLALFTFLVVAIITSQLASALRQRAELATRREREARALYELIRATTSEESLEKQLSIIEHAVVDNFSSVGVRDCTIFLPGAKGALALQTDTCCFSEQPKLSLDEEKIATSVMERGKIIDLHGSQILSEPHMYERYRRVITPGHTSPGQTFIRMIPLQVGQRVVGVVRLLMDEEARRFAVERSSTIAREQANPPTTFFWTFLDQATSVIERGRLRRENLQVELLRRTDALRSALLSSVSHDLRTPLSSIKAAASSLLQQDVHWDEEARRSFALAIEREADRLNRLVGNLLDMSRIEGGALKPEKEWYPISELIHDVLGHMQFLLQGRTVHTSIPEDLPPVQLDYLQMDQVLTNLLENTLRYTPAESPIEITAKVLNDEIVVSIGDRGPGIPPEDIEHIFDKFYRVLNTTQKGSSIMGSGLGLSVCRGLVEAHGGRIWAENRPGGGAIFRFTLPLRRTEELPYE